MFHRGGIHLDTAIILSLTVFVASQNLHVCIFFLKCFPLNLERFAWSFILHVYLLPLLNPVFILFIHIYVYIFALIFPALTSKSLSFEDLTVQCPNSVGA